MTKGATRVTAGEVEKNFRSTIISVADANFYRLTVRPDERNGVSCNFLYAILLEMVARPDGFTVHNRARGGG